MKKFASLLCAAFLSLGVLAAGGCGLLGSDEEESYGIAVTSVAILEILDEMDCDDVVGVPESSNEIPERYKDVDTIGAPMNPDFEVLVKLNPEIVLVPKTLESSLGASFKAYKLNAVYIDLSDLGQMYADILSLGELIGKEAEAKSLYDDYTDYFANYPEPETEISVMTLMCFSDGFYLVATEDSYVGNIVKLAGGTNVYGSGYVTDGSGVASVNPEDLALKDPDIIFIFAHYSEDSAFSYMRTELQSSFWQSFKAVQNGDVYFLSGADGFGMSASLDWKNALEYIKVIFYGTEAL